MKNTWLFQRIPTEFKADFKYTLAITNAQFIFMLVIWGGIRHLSLLWVDWQRYQEGMFDQVPAYRWLFYSNTSWWLILIIPIHLAYNWPRIKNRNYPIQQLVWKIDLALFFHVISVAIRIILLREHPLAEAFQIYLLLLFMICFFRLDIRRRIILLAIPLLTILLNYLINFQDLNLTMVFLYYCFAAFFVFTTSSVFYGSVIKQLLNEKQMESKNLQLLAQSTLLEQKSQLIEEQKSLIGDELMASRRQLAATALMLARKRDANDLLKTEVSGLEETAQISSVAKNKLLRIIDQTANEEDEWAHFQQQFELIEPSFLKNILNQFPALTPSDLKILTLIRMNLDSNEIARILRRTPESTKMARYRLRKRLELSNEESLEQFVTGFE
jgi:DNA-binding CsgD family transcriptional regulator